MTTPQLIFRKLLILVRVVLEVWINPGNTGCEVRIHTEWDHTHTQTHTGIHGVFLESGSKPETQEETCRETRRMWKEPRRLEAWCSQISLSQNFPTLRNIGLHKQIRNDDNQNNNNNILTLHFPPVKVHKSTNMTDVTNWLIFCTVAMVTVSDPTLDVWCFSETLTHDQTILTPRAETFTRLLSWASV